MCQALHFSRGKQAVKSAVKLKSSFSPKPKSGWHVLLSAGPTMISPDGPFYESLNPAAGVNFGFRAFHIDDDGVPKGVTVGFSYHVVKFDYDVTTSVGFGYIPLSQSGSVRVSALTLEAGRIFPIGAKGTHFYLVMGLASLEHKGRPPVTDDSFLGYEEGSRFGVKADCGIAAHLTSRLGVDFSFGFYTMITEVTYTDLGNYTETKFPGTLLKMGAGLFFLL
jgi:hypothetical protein